MGAHVCLVRSHLRSFINKHKMSKNKEKDAQMKRAYKLQMKAKAKERKQQLKEKRARLIVKNLPFAVTENNLREHFEKYGKITNVQLLKKEDGKLLGCGFVQFEAVQKAAKARHYLNGKEFLGRVIECDFTMPKKAFEKRAWQEKRAKILSEKEIKKEPVDVDMVKDEPKEPLKVDDNDVVEVKSEDDSEASTSDEEKNESDKSENEESDKSEDEESDKSEDEESDESEDDNSDDNDSIKHEMDDNNKVQMNKRKFESHDTNEGKTVFIKNLPFEATNLDLKECMMQFGPVYYALVCIDKVTEHSKGTGFVKFVNKEDADKCLQAGTELTLMGTILDCHPAVDRHAIQNKASEKEQIKQRDSRNLYLVKEGVILAGTKAAEGVSAPDMAKRLQLEQYKTQMLRNLNMFISRTRLIVHNLPPSWKDAQLRALLVKHAGPGAAIKEAKIMRNMNKLNSEGIGESKEYGFVTFTAHEHALKALRSLNNNPKIFTTQKRPIVAFSIENRVMVNAKQKRLDRSRQLNPLSKQFDPVAKKQQQEHYKQKAAEVNEGGDYSGVQSKPGVMHKARSKYKLKTQALVHQEHLKEQKKKKKTSRKSLPQRKEEFLRQGAQKINKRKQNQSKMDDDNFTGMVNAYKTKLLKGVNSLGKRGKWTES